jgi:hypothetical protein
MTSRTRCRRRLALFCAIRLFVGWASSPDTPPNSVRFASFAGRGPPQAGPNWLRFAHSTLRRSRPAHDARFCPHTPVLPSLALFRIIGSWWVGRREPDTLPDWVRFAHFASRGSGRLAKLGSFRTFRPPVPAGLPEIGFVLHNSLLSPRACPARPRRELGLFCRCSFPVQFTINLFSPST